jgi:glycosyltransferase involved in cell wall biosynthesis
MACVLFTESSPNVGGQELQLLQQMQELRKRNITTLLACRSDSRIYEVAQEKQLDPVGVPFRNSMDAVSILRLARLINANKIQAVVSHSGHDTNCASIAARLSLANPRMIRSRTYLSGKPGSWTYNKLVRKTVVPSEFLRQAILDANPRIKPDRLCVLYPGIDFSNLDRAACEPLPAELSDWLSRSQGPLIVHPAMLRPEKGHYFMLQVLSALKPKWPNLRYVAAGKGELLQSLRDEAVRLGLAEQVCFPGMLDPVAPLLKLAALVVMPSTSEPLGMAQIEALGLACAVVASKVGGIPETISHDRTGVLVEALNHEAWAHALDQAIGNPEGAAILAEAGRADVRQRFSVQSNTEALLRALSLP